MSRTDTIHSTSIILARDICNFPRVTSVIFAHEIYLIKRFGGLLPLFLFILSFFIHYMVANSTVYCMTKLMVDDSYGDLLGTAGFS